MRHKRVIDVIGQWEGDWSHAVVTRGLAQGLKANGWRIQPVQLQQPMPTLKAPFRLFVGGYPPLLYEYFQVPGKTPLVTAAFVNSESAAVPLVWGAQLAACDLVCVPSYWVRDAYKHGGKVPSRKLQVVPHGVDPKVICQGLRTRRRVLQQPRRATPYLLHVAGAASFLDRKGTPQLLQAMRGQDYDMTLVVRTPLPIHDWDPRAARADVRIETHEKALPPAEMARTIAQYDAVIQPSRAEGFGLVPLEARALGVPVIVTHCTGHAMHAEASDCIVNTYGALKSIAVQGMPNGRAPTVLCKEIQKAIEHYLQDRQRFESAAMELAEAGYARRWSWRLKTVELGIRLEYLARKKEEAQDAGQEAEG